MPPRWFHEGMDIIVFGKSYWKLHRFKDAPAAERGIHHRDARHDFYPLFQSLRSDAPFPETILLEMRRVLDASGPNQAEEFQAYVMHDWLDRWWDDLTRVDRSAIAEALRRILLDPPLLLKMATVDVLHGFIKRRYGPEDGYPIVTERRESEPSLPSDYARLNAYLESRTLDQLLYLGNE